MNAGFILGLAAAFWSANKETASRGFLRLTGVSLLFTPRSIVVLIMTFGMVVVVVPTVTGLVGLEGLSAAIRQCARWPVLFLVLIGGIALLCRLGPSRAPARWRSILPDCVLSASVWLGASLLNS